MKERLLETIKSRGYWRINFQPLVMPKNISSLGDCKEVVEKSVVSLRGWEYPCFPRDTDENHGLQPGDKYYEAWIDWGGEHKEYWRMYQSSQFIHYLALREDWLKESMFLSDPRWTREPGASLSLVGATYQITEIFEFMSRLGKNGLYDEGVRLNLSLHNTAQRSLWLRDFNRMPLSQDYRTGAETIRFENVYSKDEILSKGKENAFNIIVCIFDRFGWHRPNKEAIRTDQEKLLQRII